MAGKRKAEQVRVNWEYVDRAVIFGEVGEGGKLTFPSHRKLAARLGCSKSTIDLRAAKIGWHARRKEVLEDHTKDELLAMAKRDGRRLPKTGHVEPGLRVLSGVSPEPNGVRVNGNNTKGKPRVRRRKKPTASSAKDAVRPTDTLPVVDDQIELLLVHGEVAEVDTGQFRVRYPSHAEVAKRFGLTPDQVGVIARRANVLERRAEAQARFRRMVDDAAVEARVAATEGYRAAVLEIVQRYVSDFHENLMGGNIPADSVVDLDRLVKLAELLDGGATSRTEVAGMPSLDELAKEYAQLRGDGAADGGESPNVAPFSLDDPTTGFIKPEMN